MKTSSKILVSLLLLTPFLALAQQKVATTPKPPTDCFKEWYTLFKERGGKPVTDGTHDVILSLRNTSQGTSNCFVGKVTVEGGKIKPPVIVEKEDGSFDTFVALTGIQGDPVFMKNMGDALFSIHEGMSVNFQMADAEFGRIFFYKFLNEKPKAPKKAPSPSALIKN